MKVVNIHRRVFAASRERVGLLVDTLSSGKDAIWPSPTWPRMKLDQALGVGAAGGHGPIRYVVEAYEPGNSVRFRFTRPQGFQGWHRLEVGPQTGRGCALTHTIHMNTRGFSILLWPLVIRPLHDALLEDALSKAQIAVGERPKMNSWSWRVRALRWLAAFI